MKVPAGEFEGVKRSVRRKRKRRKREKREVRRSEEPVKEIRG